MDRYLLVSLGVVLALLLFDVRSADAQISRNNPYRSFNLSGVNYGSMQWQKKYGNQGNKSWSTGRSSGRWFRRR